MFRIQAIFDRFAPASRSYLYEQVKKTIRIK